MDRALTRAVIDAIHELQDYALPIHRRSRLPYAKLTGASSEMIVGGRRNPACWAAPIDLTCVATTPRCGTAITPMHVVAALHYPLAVGQVVKFLTMNSEEVSRTVTKTLRVEQTDIQVSVLDQPLPPTITPASLLPPTATEAGHPWVLWRSQNNCVYRGSWTSRGAGRVGVSPAQEPGWRNRTAEVAVGDSGSPVLMVLPRRRAPIALTCWTLRGQGPDLAHYATAITRLTVMNGFEHPQIAEV